MIVPGLCSSLGLIVLNNPFLQIMECENSICNAGGGLDLKVYISLSLKSNKSGLLIKLTATGQNACLHNLVQGGQWRESNSTKFHPFALLYNCCFVRSNLFKTDISTTMSCLHNQRSQQQIQRSPSSHYFTKNTQTSAVNLKTPYR